MPRLTALTVKNAKPGRHGDGQGLYLLVKPSGARSWVLRIQHDGKRHDIGLGSVDANLRSADASPAARDLPLLSRRCLTLQEARDKAAELRRFSRAGRNPIIERDRDRRKVPTFEEAAQAYHEAVSGNWSGKQAAAFLSSLEKHVYPALGKLAVDEIHANQIQQMLAPIWSAMVDMPKKVHGRVSAVLDFAHSKGWRPTEAPGRSVLRVLGKRAESGNLAAMPFADVPGFVRMLSCKDDTVGRLALLFCIHTGARSGEVRHARWMHVDLTTKLWNRPKELMKSGKAHSVTLTDDAIGILDRAKKLHPVDEEALIFPSRKALPLSDMTLSKILRDERLPYTVHGFRSSFRDWAAEMMPDLPDPVAEAALAHIVPDKVVAAYKRTPFLQMRRRLLDGWAKHLAGEPAKGGDSDLPIENKFAEGRYSGAEQPENALSQPSRT